MHRQVPRSNVLQLVAMVAEKA